MQQLREKFKDGNGSTLGKRLNGKDESVMNGKPKQSDVFLTQLNALSTQRFIRTRRLAQAQENPEVTKTVHLATVYRNIYNDVINAKGNYHNFIYLFSNMCSSRNILLNDILKKLLHVSEWYWSSKDYVFSVS